MANTITYGSDVIEVKGGSVATIHCKDKIMKDDVIVTTKGEEGNITYNDKDFAIDTNKTVTMECCGKRMTSDVMIKILDAGIIDPYNPKNCISFIGKDDNFTLTATNKEWDGILEYSTDITEWIEWKGQGITSVNGNLYLRGKNTTLRTSSGIHLQLSSSAYCFGNIMTLLDYENPSQKISSNNCFRSLFNSNTNLLSAPELPATELTPYCYSHMFYGCTALEKPPALPALELQERCYQCMFYNNENLKYCPELPAKIMVEGCYDVMFYGCNKITEPPILPALEIAPACYGQMFRNCMSLTRVPELPATAIKGNYCYGQLVKGSSVALSVTLSNQYRSPWRIPSTGTGSIVGSPTSPFQEMFYSTKGTFTGEPEVNTTYYGDWDSENMLINSVVEIASGTSLSSTIKTSIGNTVLAAIVTRDTLEISSDWSLISTSSTNSNDTTNGQRLSWAYKIADADSTLLTVNQASEQRLYINMIVLKGKYNFIDNGFTYDNNENDTASTTVLKPEGTIIWAATQPKWDTNTSHSIWSSSNCLDLCQLPNSTQPRLALGIDDSEETEVIFTGGTAGSTRIIGCLSPIKSS